jgi:cell division protein FtsA
MDADRGRSEDLFETYPVYGENKPEFLTKVCAVPARPIYMAKQSIVTGIDIGTYHTKVVIAERAPGPRALPRIMGTGYAETRGMRHGYIVSPDDVSRSIELAVAQAEKAAKVKVKRAYVSIGGMSIDEVFSRGEAVVTRGDSIISERDVAQASLMSEGAISPSQLLNRTIIHSVPLRFAIDGAKVLGNRPAGMHGMKVSVEALFVTALTQHVAVLRDAVEEAGIEVEDVVAAPLAASFVTLGKPQKMAGCVLANIGAETLSIIVFEDGKPISMKVFPMGGADITNDIALGLRVPLEEAEQLKLGAVTGATYPKKKLDDIITRRLTEMFALVEGHLRKLGKNGLLPAGIIITGGGSGLLTISDLAKAALKLPARIGNLGMGDNTKMQLKDGSWAVAYGLTIWAMSQSDGTERRGSMMGSSLIETAKKWLKPFLP